MARAATIQTSFNGGELSPRLDGRVDVSKYGSGCKRMENFIPLIQGPAQRRGGFRYVGEVKTSATKTWLLPFQFNTQQAYQLEFGNGYIRFWLNHAPLTISTPATWSAITTYFPGDLVNYLGVNYYAIAGSASNPNLNKTPPNAAYWYPLTGNIYEIPSPYLTADLTDADGYFNLRVAQSADVMYICHPSYQQRKLQRFGATKWLLDLVATQGGPFKNENITTTTVYSDVNTGSVVLTASSALFVAEDVGTLFKLNQKSLLSVRSWSPGIPVSQNDILRSDGKNYKAISINVVAPNVRLTGNNRPVHTIGAVWDGPQTVRGNAYVTSGGVLVAAEDGAQWEYQNPGYGLVRIDSFVSSTVVNGTVMPALSTSSTGQIPADAVGIANASTRWSKAAWSSVEGYPTQVNFFRERLIFARNQSLWMSVSGDYENFSAVDASNLVTADSAVSITLVSPQVNKIRWMEPANGINDALICGTAGSEFAVKSLTSNLPFGPGNVTGAQVSTLGSINSRPVSIGSVLLFIQAAGTKLRDVSYNIYNDSYVSNDQTVLAEHISLGGFNHIAFQHEPYSLVWAVKKDGTLVCMTYSREQYPDAPHGGWHKHPIGGNGFVESISVIPAPDLLRDELWAIIRYTVNGVTKRYICYMDWELRFGYDPMDSFYMDCGISVVDTVIAAGTLTPGAGATVVGTTGVTFTQTSATFLAGHIGREIHYTYSTTDHLGETVWLTAKATLTGFTSTAVMTGTILVAFPNLTPIATGTWRITFTAVTSLDYLEGKTVDVLADGAAHPQRTVTAGTFNLQAQASKIQIGFNSPARLKTMRLNAGSQDGTSQGKKSKLTRVVIRLLQTLGLRFGKDFDTLAPLEDADFRSAQDLMDNASPLFTGDMSLDYPSDWDTSPWVCVEQADPLPATIVAIMPQVSVNDRG